MHMVCFFSHIKKGMSMMVIVLDFSVVTVHLFIYVQLQY
jgi:hypothetical protein